MSGIQQMTFGGGTSGSPTIITSTFTSSGTISGDVTVPAGMNHVTIKVYGSGGWGGSGLGGPSYPSAYIGGGGGGASGCATSYYACSPGQTIHYIAGGIVGNDGVASSGTLSITTMTAIHGLGGGSAVGVTPGTGGAGGSATGGNVSNITGTAGGDGAYVNYPYLTPAGGLGGQNGTDYSGYGGNGGESAYSAATIGGQRTVIFIFTSA